MRLQVKNWPQFQHYKDRAPPWIKLHKSLLDDYTFHKLPVASRALAPCIWLLASESEDGSVSHDPETIAFRLRMSVKDVELAIQPLVSTGFLIVLRDASDTLAEQQHDDSDCLALARSQETETETEKNTRAPRSVGGLNGSFAEFWNRYPKKRSKGQAEKVWLKIGPDADLKARIFSAIESARESPEWARDGGQFIPYPATWLNAKGWEDSYCAEVAVTSTRPSITCHACKKRAFIWTDGQCDPCWRKSQGITA